jgi:hypothetical protein
MTKSCEPKPAKCPPPEHDKPCHPDHPDHPVNDCPSPDNSSCDDTHAALLSAHVGIDHIAQIDVNIGEACHDLVDVNLGLDCHDTYHA